MPLIFTLLMTAPRLFNSIGRNTDLKMSSTHLRAINVPWKKTKNDLLSQQRFIVISVSFRNNNRIVLQSPLRTHNYDSHQHWERDVNNCCVSHFSCTVYSRPIPIQKTHAMLTELKIQCKYAMKGNPIDGLKCKDDVFWYHCIHIKWLKNV